MFSIDYWRIETNFEKASFLIHALERTQLDFNNRQGISWRYTEYKFNTYHSMVRRYPRNPRGTKNVFSDIRVLSIRIYVLSLWC